MNRARKRRIRLGVALGVACLMAVALIYTSFTASSETRQPSDLLKTATEGKTYQLTGKVVAGSIKRDGEQILFRVRDRDGKESVPVSYSGVVPDPFRDDREIIIDVKKQGASFTGERDTLITKCPSKFTSEQTASLSNR